MDFKSYKCMCIKSNLNCYVDFSLYYFRIVFLCGSLLYRLGSQEYPKGFFFKTYEVLPVVYIYNLFNLTTLLVNT